ncbi:ChrR family anti-sigma-E factor [Azorhizobium caulinodans]|uniref:ChrR family anti-sigma-E factor n=1 Tax=Azorhizobium caulinodans TaxID=7 RepID=UPI002FBEBD4F
MTTPHDETLASYAAGTLDAGIRLAVAAHLEAAPKSRARLAHFEAAAGAVLDDLPPTDLANDALERLLARLDEPEPPPPAPIPVRHAARMPTDVRLPKALEGCSIGRWIWIGPGVRYSAISIPGAPKANVGLVEVGPGRRMPDHGHGGNEITYVISGGFSDENGHYEAGDVCEADESLEHQPVADPEGCLCIIAMDAPMRFKGLLGAVLKPFTG